MLLLDRGRDLGGLLLGEVSFTAHTSRSEIEHGKRYKRVPSLITCLLKAPGGCPAAAAKRAQVASFER